MKKKFKVGYEIKSTIESKEIHEKDGNFDSSYRTSS